MSNLILIHAQDIAVCLPVRFPSKYMTL